MYIMLYMILITHNIYALDVFYLETCLKNMQICSHYGLYSEYLLDETACTQTDKLYDINIQ